MTHDHHDAGLVGDWLAASAAVTAVIAVALYFVAAQQLCRRGDRWPLQWTSSFAAGGVAVVVAAVVPLPGAAFTVHMIQHTIVGMAAPVLVVCARPITLTLRSLPAGRARRVVLALLHSRPATVLTFPPVAAVLDVGGLWLLYRTGLFASVHDRPLLHALIYVHTFLAGLLFTVAVTQLEPVRHRYSLALRAATLVGAAAAHGILAKSLYGAALPGTTFAVADVQLGAQIMYYGGDLVELALAGVIAWQWYQARGRELARTARDVAPAGLR